MAAPSAVASAEPAAVAASESPASPGILGIRRRRGVPRPGIRRRDPGAATGRTEDRRYSGDRNRHGNGPRRHRGGLGCGIFAGAGPAAPEQAPQRALAGPEPARQGPAAPEPAARRQEPAAPKQEPEAPRRSRRGYRLGGRRDDILAGVGSYSGRRPDTDRERNHQRRTPTMKIAATTDPTSANELRSGANRRARRGRGALRCTSSGIAL